MPTLRGSLLASLLAFAATLAWGALPAHAADRPNILWIVSEDNGPFLGCYGDSQAKTPTLDALAARGTRYALAFANAPVCAPSRCTLVTGMYATSLGTLHMRSVHPVPADLPLYPTLLRQAGYFATNHSKTDYNFTGPSHACWDKGKDWSDRPSGKPFFSVINLNTTHESSLHKTKVDPANLRAPFKLPPYHPDLPEIRSNWVEYYKKITQMDSQVADILARLRKDGLEDDTIVVYCSDHAGILPRSKRFLYDTGLRVPLIVAVPPKWQRLAPGPAGGVSERMVGLIDLTPSLLSLAGAEIPAGMQGKAFLGPKAVAEGSPYVIGFRGRMDERYDMIRTVREARFRYIRNYHPHLPLGQPLEYLWKMPATQAWERAYKEGKCDAIQSAFWKEKPTEELYDTQADPWEVKNLAGDPAHRATLERLRGALRGHVLATRDAGFLPESLMVERAGRGDILGMARDDARYPLATLLDAAEMAAQRDEAAVPRLIELAKHSDPGVRYWAAMGCVIRGKTAANAEAAMRGLLNDPEAAVRIAAGDALTRMGHADAGLPVLVAALDLQGGTAQGAYWNKLAALNALQALGPMSQPCRTQAKPKVQALAGSTANATAAADIKKVGMDYNRRAAETLLESW